jgi:hypothetical protein
MHHFDSRTDHLVHDRRRAKGVVKPVSSSVGFFESLSEKMQEAGIEMARLLRPEARINARADRREQAEYRALMRAQNLQVQLDAIATKGAIACDRFEEYSNGQGYSTPAEAMAALRKVDALTGKRDFLRHQIEMRVNGLGWSDFATPWQKTGESLQASVTRLQSHLKDVLVEETVRRRRGEIVWRDGTLIKPTEAAMPDFKSKTLKQLGTPTDDSTELAARALCSPEQLAAAIVRERERREAAGFTDREQMKQPPDAPPLDSNLVGKQLEICWGNYISTVDNKSKVKMWCPAKVVRIADGETDKGMDNKPLSDRAIKLAPRGMVLVEWEPDLERGEKTATTIWYLLDPRKWNGDGHRAWRYHPNELAAQQQRAADARAAGKRPCERDRA